MVKWAEFYTFCQVLNRASKGKVFIAYFIIALKVKIA